MSMPNVFATVAFLGIAAFWGEVVVGALALTSAAKLLQTVTLAWGVQCWASDSLAASRDYARRIAAGLAFSIFGDFFMMIGVHAHRPSALAAGVLAFAFTQLFYTRALRRVGSRPAPALLLGLPAIFAALAASGRLTLGLPNAFVAGGALYAILLGVTVAHATAGLRNDVLPFAARRAAARGAWLFAITDGLLPLVVFGPAVGIDVPHLGLWVYQAYIVSQCFFALSAFRLRSTED